jgi:hypothetical protein
MKLNLKSLFLFALLAFVVTASTSVKAQTNSDETIYSKIVDVSSAEILASFTTEKVLVTVPNSDYAIIPVSVIIEFKYGTTTYNDASGASFVTYAGSATGYAFTTILASTSSQVQPAPIGVILARTAVKGKNLVYKHSTANPTTGNGTMKIYILYRLLNLTSGGY